MKNIAIFISGGGSDMQSVIDGVESGQINGKVVCVVANKDEIFGLERAKKHNIPTKVFAVKDFDNNFEMRDLASEQYLKPLDIDLIVLAGYLSILSPKLIERYRGKIINIHPSLIPKHCGMGMYGLKVHEAVIADKDVATGATVHYVDEGADTGKIIFQSKIKVLATDTPESLQKRVLEIEHKILPQVVAYLCKDNLTLAQSRLLNKQK
ncbi:MAG: phosphoribosylglycinamide formyltransferase [Clostridia bacterium]